MDQLGGSQADHMLPPNNISSYSSSLWDSTLSKYWLWRLSQHVCVVTATVWKETQSPSDWSMTHFILSKLPCGWRERKGIGGTKAVSWWVWLRLNPGTLWGLPFQRTLIEQGELACLLTGLSCAAHAHQWEAGDRHTILIAQCVCLCGVCDCVSNWQQEAPAWFVLQPWLGRLFIDIFCGSRRAGCASVRLWGQKMSIQQLKRDHCRAKQPPLPLSFLCPPLILPRHLSISVSI